jgi:hypothetical protein
MEPLQEQINSLVQSCLGITAQILATQAVLFQMQPDLRQRLTQALVATRLEADIASRGKTLDEATVRDLEQEVLGMGRRLNEMLAGR